MTFTAALIGLGQIGMGFERDPLRAKPASHLGALKHLRKQIQLTYTVDLDREKRSQAETFYYDGASGLGSYKYASDYVKEMRETDIVVVATQDDTHSNIVRELLRRNKARLIFVEKPLATSRQDAEDLVDSAKKKEVSLCVNNTRRWDHDWIEVVNHVNNMEIGYVKHLIGFYSGDKWRVGSHMADLVNWLGCADKHTVTRLDVHYLFFEVHVVGSDGRLTICDNGRSHSIGTAQDSYRYSNVKELVLTHEYSSPRYTNTPLLRAYENIIAHLENGEPLACDGSMGVEAVRLVEKWK